MSESKKEPDLGKTAIGCLAVLFALPFMWAYGALCLGLVWRWHLTQHLGSPPDLATLVGMTVFARLLCGRRSGGEKEEAWLTILSSFIASTIALGVAYVAFLLK